MYKPLAWLAAVIFFLQASVAASQQADVSDVSEAIRVEIEQLRRSGVLSIGDVDIASGALLAEVYERRNYAPNWTGVQSNTCTTSWGKAICNPPANRQRSM